MPVTDEAAERLERERGVRVYLSDSISMPLTIGIFPRKIFVPASWKEWSPQCRRMVLEHEMAHIERRDGLVQVLQIVVCALYFFHPLVLLLGRRLNEYREMACDDASTGNGRSSSIEYSRYLVEIAESIVNSPAACESASALIRRRNELLNRVRYQIGEGKMRTVSKRKAAVVLAMLVILVLPLSWYAGNAAPAEDGKSSAGKVLAVTSPGKPGPDGMRDITVIVRGGCDEILVDEEKTVLAGFLQMLEKSTKDDRENVVINLLCEDDVPMGTVYQVQNVLRELELTKINYVKGENVGLPLELPSGNIEERIKKIPESMFLNVVVDETGRIEIGGKETGPEDVVKAVEYELYENPVLIVYLKTSQKTKYKDFLTALELVKDAGAQRILVHAPVKKDM
jgi:biopolymer transport protein ExbD